MAVHDLVYRRLDHPRRPPELPALAIARADLRVLRKRKSLTGALLALGVFSFLTTGYVVLRSGILSDVMPAWLALLQKAPPIDATFFAYCFASASWPSVLYQFLLVVLAVFAGAGRIAEDLRTNALALYLAKPLTRGDYLSGKIGAVASIVALGALGSPLLAYVSAVLVDPAFLGQNLRLGGSILLLGLITTAYHTSAILLCSSLTRSGRVAGLLFAGLYFMSGTLHTSAKLALHTDNAAFLGYAANLETLGLHLLPAASVTADGATMGGMGSALGTPGPLLPSLVVIACVIGFGFLFARQRVRAVEVVR